MPARLQPTRCQEADIPEVARSIPKPTLASTAHHARTGENRQSGEQQFEEARLCRGIRPVREIYNVSELYILSAAIICQRRPPNEHLIGNVAAILAFHSADKGVLSGVWPISRSPFPWYLCDHMLPTLCGTIPCRGNSSGSTSKASAAGCRRAVIDRVDRRASLALVASSLLYFLVLGGIEGELGTTQIQGRPDVESTSSRAHLVR